MHIKPIIANIRVGTIEELLKKFKPMRLLLSVCCHSLTSPDTVLEALSPRKPRMTVTTAKPVPMVMVVGSTMVSWVWEMDGVGCSTVHSGIHWRRAWTDCPALYRAVTME